MNVTVVAGIIGAGGAIVVAITSYVASTKNAHTTANASTTNIRLMIQAEHERHLWDRRADLYVDILAFATHRHRELQQLLKGFERDDKTEAETEAFLASYQGPPWFELEARMHAFASDEVLEAFVKTVRAVDEIRGAAAQREGIWSLNRQAIEQGSEVSADVSSRAARRATAGIRKALEAGAQAVGNLIDGVRSQLQIEPAD